MAPMAENISSDFLWVGEEFLINSPQVCTEIGGCIDDTFGYYIMSLYNK